MKLDIIYEKVAQDLNIPIDVVKKSYNGYWKSIRLHIANMDFSQTTDSYSINLPSLGKLQCKKKYSNGTKYNKD